MPSSGRDTALVDRSLILKKIAALDTYLEQISPYSELSSDAYRADWKTQRIIERTLQMMIETCVDIATHIISDASLRTPENYADTFRVLSENGIISAELSVSLEKMVKFRNVVVHQYEAVDPEIVIAILKKHLVEFPRFKDVLLQYVKRQ